MGGSLKSNLEEITILEAPELEPLTDVIEQMTTNEQFGDSAIIAAIDTHTDPGPADTTVAETGNAGTTSVYAGTRSCSMGTGGGGGFDSLDALSGPSTTLQKKRGGRLLGAEPGIFYGDRTKAENFWDEWTSYVLLNHKAPAIVNEYTRSMLLITYMKGPLVKEWTWNLKAWLLEQRGKGINAESSRIINGTEVQFKEAFTDSLTKDCAQQELKRLRADTRGLDHYISRFEELARTSGYNVKKENVLLECFINGLPTRLAAEVMAKNDPKTYKDWKKGVIAHNCIFYNLQQRFRKNYRGLPTVPQPWLRNDQTRRPDPDAMDTSWCIKTRVMLTKEEQDRL